MAHAAVKRKYAFLDGCSICFHPFRTGSSTQVVLCRQTNNKTKGMRRTKQGNAQQKNYSTVISSTQSITYVCISTSSLNTAFVMLSQLKDILPLAGKISAITVSQAHQDLMRPYGCGLAQFVSMHLFLYYDFGPGRGLTAGNSEQLVFVMRPSTS